MTQDDAGSRGPHALILTGAGASVEAGVPTAIQLTQRIDEVLSARNVRTGPGTVFRYVVGGLMMAKGQDGRSPYDGINVEEVFSAVELLANRGNLEAAPFIGSWHAGVESLDRTAVRYDRLARALVEQVAEAFERGRVSFASHSFKREFESAVRETMSGGTGAVYAETAAKMLSALKALVRINSAQHVSYLKPLMEYVSAHQSEVATLNYDTSLEAVAASIGVPCSTGITTWAQGLGLRWNVGETRLLKLHGSISWEFKRTYAEHGTTVDFVEHPWPEAAEQDPILLFGQRDKLKVDGPFLDLLMEFRRALNTACGLLVVGYSFRDSHVNHFIHQWLETGERKHIVVLDPSFPAPESDFAKELDGLGHRWITKIRGGTADSLPNALAALEAAVDSVAADPVREPGYRISDALAAYQTELAAKRAAAEPSA